MVDTLERAGRKAVESQVSKQEPTGYRSACTWPRTILEAYRRERGPYTILNALTLLEEEPLELYNGWLVWQEMTDALERRIANIIQVILDLAARTAGFGQAYPDQLECEMVTGNVVKPDVCLISNQRFAEKVRTVDKKGKHHVLKGGPELVVELRSPSNTREEEGKKRANFFASGTLVIWDVDPVKHKIWVYEVEKPSVGREYKTRVTVHGVALTPNYSKMGL